MLQELLTPLHTICIESLVLVVDVAVVAGAVVVEGRLSCGSMIHRYHVHFVGWTLTARKVLHKSPDLRLKQNASEHDKNSAKLKLNATRLSKLLQRAQTHFSLKKKINLNEVKRVSRIKETQNKNQKSKQDRMHIAWPFTWINLENKNHRLDITVDLWIVCVKMPWIFGINPNILWKT